MANNARRLKLMEKAGYFRNDETIQITQAYTIDEYRQSLALVHNCFVEAGIIQPEPSGMRVRVFDLIPETSLYVAKCDNKIIGVTGLTLDSPSLGLPSDCAFKAEIDKLRREGKVCEGTDWAVCREFRRSPALLMLMRLVYAAAIQTGMDYLLAAVSPKHAALYQLVGFKNLAQGLYSTNDYVYLMMLNLSCHSCGSDMVDKWFTTDNPYLEGSSPVHHIWPGW